MNLVKINKIVKVIKTAVKSALVLNEEPYRTFVY